MLLVVLLAALVLGGTVWLVTAEVASVAGELPTYTENIKEKIRSLRELGQGSVAESLEKMIQDITGEWLSRPAMAAQAVPGLPSGRGSSRVAPPGSRAA